MLSGIVMCLMDGDGRVDNTGLDDLCKKALAMKPKVVQCNQTNPSEQLAG